jgi:hypothetical protein
MRQSNGCYYSKDDSASTNDLHIVQLYELHLSFPSSFKPTAEFNRCIRHVDNLVSIRTCFDAPLGSKPSDRLAEPKALWIIVTVSVPRLRPILVVRKKTGRSGYNNGFSNEGSFRGRPAQHRFGGSAYQERSSDGTPIYPRPARMHWHDNDSDSHNLIALESDISASHSMQKFLHS